MAQAVPEGSRRRLLFVTNAAWFFVSHRLPLAVAARSSGYDVHVASAHDPAVETLRASGFPHHALPLARGSGRVRGELESLLALFRLYRRLSPDIVHHVTVKPVLYGSLAARAARVPAVVNAVSGLGSLYLASGFAARARVGLVRSLLRLGAAHPHAWHIFQNPADQEEYWRSWIAAPERSLLVPGSGVDLTEYRYRPEPDGPPVVILPARLLGDKGVREFVDAARRLRPSFPEVRFALVGPLDPDNPSAIPGPEVEGWVREGAVEWWGVRRDMPDVLALASIVCLPSYREGMPKALLEAAAVGRPIVTTDVPGCRDVIGEAPMGRLVPARDAAALAAALGELLRDPALRLSMGVAARRRAEAEFGVDRVVEATLALYRKALA